MPPKAKTETTTDPFGTDETSAGTELTLTIKGGSSYDAPWLVARVPSLDQADELLSNRDLLDTVTTKMWDAAQKFAAKGPEKAAAGSNAGGGGGTARQAPSGPPPGVETPECTHGPMQYRTGITKSGPKAGETWKAFMCPQPKGATDQCKPQFLK